MKRSISMKTIIAATMFFSAIFFSCQKNNSSNPSPSYSSSGNTTSGGNTGGNNVAEVDMLNNAYNPASITIAKGTTVTWINKDATVHTVTSGSLFDSGDITQGKSFSHTFNSAGTYSYYCTYHRSMGMTGRVVVQ
jgi:plastocyanin